jgi:uracil-DNA glycosylase family 4
MSEVESMKSVETEIKVCIKCNLWKERKNAVPGNGNTDAVVVFVGEAPGYWEDVKGQPFVGAAGKSLDEFLLRIGLPREQVFITNVVKCRPPRNREPKPVEIQTCTSLYLGRQIELIQPKVVVALGRHSAAYLFLKAGFEAIETISRLRGKVYEVNLWGISVLLVPMYHPATVLYNPKYRRDLEADFDLLKTELGKRGYI